MVCSVLLKGQGPVSGLPPLLAVASAKNFGYGLPGKLGVHSLVADLERDI
jgi:hypothetical protein